MRTLFLLPVAFLASAIPTQAQMAIITPAQIGEIFCIASQGNDMAPVEALLTPQLSEAIGEARQKNAAFEAAHPGDKPPLGDGLPWRGWQDYADTCTVSEVITAPGTTSVTITYVFSSTPDATYTNSLRLQPVETETGLPPFWRIDDVDLGDHNTLRKVLLSGFEL